MVFLQNEKVLDELDWAIMHELQVDARLSYSELARRVNSSPPTVTERVRRLEDQGIITGYTAQIDRRNLGWPITAFIRLVVPTYRTSKVDELIKSRIEISECHRITGDDCLIIKAHGRTVGHLEDLLRELTRYGASSTSIVLSSLVTEREVVP